jgi:hypothetical protein
VNATVTLGGLTIGLALLMHEFLPYAWQLATKKAGGGGAPGKLSKGAPAPAPTGKGFDAKAHAPYFLGNVVGMLAISCPGGLVGLAAARILSLLNFAGDKALTTGAGAATGSVTRHAATQLSATGSVVTLLLVLSVVFLWKRLPKAARWQLARGMLCGIALGLSSGAAGLTGSVLIPGANQVGDAIGGAL